MLILHKTTDGWEVTTVVPGVDHLAEAAKLYPAGSTVYFVNDDEFTDDALFPAGLPDPATFTRADYDAAIDAFVANRQSVTI